MIDQRWTGYLRRWILKLNQVLRLHKWRIVGRGRDCSIVQGSIVQGWVRLSLLLGE